MMKILVVDDERDIQTLFEQRFRKEIRDKFLEFAFAFSGEDALTYLNQHKHETVLILSDINMPGMSGLELQRQLAADHNRTPIVFITAHNDPGSRALALQAGAVAFLSKPFKEEALFEAIRSAIEPRRG